MPRDDQHNPDHNANAARIVKESTGSATGAMTIAELEQRVIALEREIAAIKSAIKKGPSRESAMATFGVFADCPEFDEAVRLGREYRDQENRESLESES